jgi:hypothetical protein
MDLNDLVRERYGVDTEKSPVMVPGLGREGLFTMFHDLGFREGAEVGVFDGENARTIFRVMPGVHLIMVDPWDNYSLGSRDYGDIIHRAEERARRRVRKHNATIHKMLSEEAARLVPDNSLDFVYIDGDHSYDHSMLDTILWFRKVKKGGVVSGHDYFYNERQNKLAKVTSMVNDYTRVHRVRPWYTTDNRDTAVRGDRYCSWFFVKPLDRWGPQ